MKSATPAVFFYLLVLSCSTQKIDYDELGSLIKNDQSEQALIKIKAYKETTRNPLELQKLNQLYISADKNLLFKELSVRLAKQDTSGIKNDLQQILQKIEQKDSLAQRWYYFDYYKSQADFFSLMSDSAGQVKALLRTGAYPVKDIQKRINVCFDLAFHYAQLKQFDIAREWLDKALRSFEKNDHHGPLLNVYMEFMNGNFNRADSILKEIPAENKTLNWQRVESFFNLYLNSLSLKNRFRLW